MHPEVERAIAVAGDPQAAREGLAYFRRLCPEWFSGSAEEEAAIEAACAAVGPSPWQLSQMREHEARWAPDRPPKLGGHRD